VPPVALALGSNLGDRRAHLAWAVDRLSTLLQDCRSSSFIETEPVGVPDAQPPYLNAAAIGTTRLEPHALLAALMVLEQERGRIRTSFRGARTLDLDLILYGDVIIADATLTIPHPRFRERQFVLEPLASIAPEWIDPITGQTMRQLLTAHRL
jgi:2-amino-4-hydroxy-6-hydroxymethyldihydropteridine diphosphokinase